MYDYWILSLRQIVAGTYKNFVAEERIDSVNNLAEYAEELKSQVKYWDGEKFVNEPVMNKNYLDAK